MSTEASPNRIAESLAPLVVPIDSVNLDEANARTHSGKNLDAIKASLTRFGQRLPIVVQEQGRIVRAGNGRVAAARALGWTEIAAVIVDESNVEAAAFAIADNRTAELGEWDDEALAQTLKALEDEDALDGLGFDDDDLAALVGDEPPVGVVEDEIPEPPADPVTKPGDLWALGRHRVLCGDSTSKDDVARVMDGEKAPLVHADPPYGMGKESAGIANDNLYREKLDAFQMTWWNAFRPHVDDNGSAYIWGNAEDLWRLWYRGGLADSERLTVRNEVVWSKGSAGAGGISHVGAEGLRLFPQSTERCLFFMLGEQGFNNNADNYWEGWEPVRSALAADCKAMGWDAKDIARICGVGMHGHWFTKSQWTLIPREHYEKLQTAARDHDAFKRDHDELKRDHDELKRDHDELKQAFYATRAYFDNTHDNMTDVWEFPRVTGEDRQGHATPKPVAMISRAIKSSTPEGATIAEPFLGSGTTLIAAEQLGRTCYGIEISPAYCDVTIARWEALTGEKATLIDGPASADGDAETALLQ